MPLVGREERDTWRTITLQPVDVPAASGLANGVSSSLS